MRVLMIAPEPYFQTRGTPFSVYHRLEAMATLGHTVDLVTYHLGEDRMVPGLRIFRIWRVPLIHRVPVGPSYLKLLLDFLLTVRVLSLVLRFRYDAVHTHEEAVVLGAVLHKLVGIPHLYDMHSSLPEQLVNYDFIHSPFLLRLARKVERWVLRNSDAVIPVCKHLEQHANSLPHPGKIVRIENVALPWDPQKSEGESARELRGRLGLDDSLVATYTGNLEVNQGIEILIKSIPHVLKEQPRMRFLLVGGEPEQREALGELARSLKVERALIFAGKRPPGEMGSYLGMSDILLSPRCAGRNTPLKIYSYLWAGKAIVATNLSTHTQVLTPEVALLTDVTPEGLGAGIARLGRDASLREKLGKKARELAGREYSYSGYVAKTREVYEYLSGRKRSR